MVGFVDYSSFFSGASSLRQTHSGNGFPSLSWQSLMLLPSMLHPAIVMDKMSMDEIRRIMGSSSNCL
jgi:hypothetical protein